VGSDGSDGTRPRVGTVCPYGALPPTQPDGGYPEYAITSCAGLTAVNPPDVLATLGCSPGWSLSSLFVLAPNESIFLCPTGTVLPPDISPQLARWYPQASNGCFGASAFPDYEYVVYDAPDQPPSPQPSNCSGGCAHF
jgi:hypothetical protein